MSSYNLHKPLQSISTLLDHFIREPIREYLLSAFSQAEKGSLSWPFQVEEGY